MIENWSHIRQLEGWRFEVKGLGHRLEHAKTEEEVHLVSTLVRDLRVRVRRACDEFGIFTDGTESLDNLIRSIVRKLNV